MVPTDVRAPATQQRWIECYNGGSSSIPAHSVVQIIEAERVDTHRTALIVSEAIEDSPQATCMTYHIAISTSSYGLCTMDSPGWATVDGTPSAGDTMGLATGGTELVSGKTGYIVLGDVHDGIARVMKQICP